MVSMCQTFCSLCHVPSLLYWALTWPSNTAFEESELQKCKAFYPMTSSKFGSDRLELVPFICSMK